MRSPQSRRNGETPSPRPRIQVSPPHFHSTVSEQKIKRINVLILVFRLGAFCFSMASTIFMVVSPRASNSPRWYDYSSFRFVLAANGIVAVYSLVEMGAAVWEISTGATIFPEIFQVWFDFSHDQVFAYLLLSASSTGAGLAWTLRTTDTCTISNAFCVQTDISVALGFIGFVFLGLSSLLSGFRVACYIVKGSRFHILGNKNLEMEKENLTCFPLTLLSSDAVKAPVGYPTFPSAHIPRSRSGLPSNRFKQNSNLRSPRDRER